MSIAQLVFVGLRGYIVALDRDSGQTAWTWTAPRMSASGFTSVVLDGDRLIAGINGYVFCLDAHNGGLLWENPLRGYGEGVTCITTMRAQTYPALQAAGGAQEALNHQHAIHASHAT